MNKLQINKSPHKSFFTMIELIAVISIMAILLTISIKAMKTDSTSANTSILGSTLQYAQIYAMSSLEPDGTQTVEVEVEANKITINIVDTNPVSTTLLKEEDLAAGSTITEKTGTYVFDYNGKPDTTEATTFIVADNRDPDNNKLEVTLRAFTGKVIYY